MANKTRYILVVDDNIHHVELITEVFDSHFQPAVVHAVDAFNDAIKLLSSSAYDLIITEGVVGGDYLIEYIDQIITAAKPSHVVVISGRGDERMAAKLIKKGVSDYFVKCRETLENLPDLLTKHLMKKSRKSSDQNKENYTPSKMQFKEEFDKLIQDALFIISKCSKCDAPKSKQMQHMLETVSKLRNMVDQI